MPRISEINEADGEPILEEVFEQERQMFGKVLNPTRVLAHCPTILKCAKNLYASFEESGLVPSTLLALVYARVASLNGCPFWVDINSFRANEAEDGAKKVANLANWPDSDVYTEQERIVLEYGDRMTITGKTVDDEFFTRLLTYFTEAQVVELTAGIAMENFRSKFNAPLKIEAQGFCQVTQT